MWQVVPNGKTTAEESLSSFRPPNTWSTFHHRAHQSNGWTSLCTAVSQASDYHEISWNYGEETYKDLVILLAACAVSNEVLRKQVETKVGKVEVRQAALKCLEHCIADGQEDLACGLVQFSQPLPLHLLHRAGEQGMQRFLLTLHKACTPVQTNRVIASLPGRVHRLLRHSAVKCLQRFPAVHAHVTEQDLLHWAYLSGGAEAVSELARTLHPAADALIEVLSTEGLGDLLVSLLPEYNAHSLDLSPLFAHGYISLALRIIQHTKRPFSTKTPHELRSYKVIQRLITLITDPEDCISALYLLSLVQKFEWSPAEVDALYAVLRSTLVETDLETNILVSCSNSLLFCVAVSELCGKIALFSLTRRDTLMSLGGCYLQLAEAIQAQYTDYLKLKVLYMERAYGSQCLFDVITQHTDRYRSLLKTEMVAAIVLDLWTGGDAEGLNFSYLCAANFYLDASESELFQVHRNYAQVRLPGCIFQLYYWKSNASLRFLVETIMLLGICCILVSQIDVYIEVRTIMEDPVALFTTNIDELYAKLDFQETLGRVILGCAATLVLNIIQKVIYKWRLGEAFNLNFADLLSLVIFTTSLIINILIIPSVRDQMSFEKNTEILEYFFAVMIFCICMRMSTILLFTRTFGPWIRMISVITKDIVVYLLIYLLAVLSFALTYVVLFRREVDYFGSIQLSVRTLFQWSVAGIDSTIFTAKEELGSVLAIAWAFVSSILLLNLLIAVLSSRFEALAPQVMADYASLMYQSYSQSRYKPPYGGLVVAPAPLNSFTAGLVPLYLLFPRTAPTLDPVFVLLSYQVWFLTGCALFLLYCLKSSLLAYFYIIVHRIKHHKQRKGSLLLWVFLGPFYLLFLVCVSLLRFSRLMYRRDSEDLPGVSLSVCCTAKRFVEEVCASGVRWLSIQDVEMALSRLPRSKVLLTQSAQPTRLFTQRKHHFREVADRVYFSKGLLTDERARDTRDFFRQFASVGERSDQVDMSRMRRVMERHWDAQEKLTAVSISAVQSALVQLRGSGLKI